jgi:hypothetical protein
MEATLWTSIDRLSSLKPKDEFWFQAAQAID